MRVEDIMTIGCESIGEHDSIFEAAKRMRELDVGALPILGDDDTLKGVVTDRDIVTEVVSEGLDPADVEAGRLGGLTVTVESRDDLDRAMQLMSVQQIRRLPVVDASGKLIGIVSQADIATHAENRRSGEMLESISEEL